MVKVRVHTVIIGSMSINDVFPMPPVGLSLSRHTHFTTSHATHLSTVQNRFKCPQNAF